MRFVPALVFTTVYVVTCLIGAVVLLLDVRPLVSLFEHFTGTGVPRLDPAQFRVAVVLLTAPPILFWFGYILGTFALRDSVLHEISTRTRFRLAHSSRVPIAAFVVSAAIAIASLLRAGALADLAAWFNYQSWIDARWHLFQNLSFFEFVNLYTIAPLTAAWVLITMRSHSSTGLFLRVLPALTCVAFTLAVYQKKAALIALGIVFSSWLLAIACERPRLALRGLVGGLALSLALYLAMVVVPTANAAVEVARSSQRDRPVVVTSPLPSGASTTPNSSNANTGSPVSTAETPRPVPSAPSVTPAPNDLTPEQLDPATATILYALLGTLMRTSAPALYYPVVFPDVHGYYAIDLGQDIVCSPRLGCRNEGMPDDNLVVWDYMNPQFHGGSITAPFQFALYSQGGLVPAVLGSIVLGFLMGAGWQFVRAGPLPQVWGALFGAILVLLATNLALDSPRNSVLVSYGALWGAVFLIACAALVHLANSTRTQARRPSPKSIAP